MSQPIIFPLKKKEDFVWESKKIITKNTKNSFGGSMVSEEYTIDGKFECIILIVEETSCGKTTFIQNLAKKQLVW